MFNQQQQFHQLIQLQHLLQQQQHTVQQPAHHPQTAQHSLPAQHAAPRPMPNSVQQPQQMLNLRAANPARLLNTHPMIQRAMLMQQMQGNLRGLSMVAPPMPPFFTAAARHSILGIPPMGVTVKAPGMTFPPIPYQQPRVYHKGKVKVNGGRTGALLKVRTQDHYRNPDAKRDGDRGSSVPGKDANDTNAERGNAELPPTASEADESLNSEDTENLTECSITDPLEPSAKRARSSETGTDEMGFTAEGMAAEERSVKSQSSEGISGGRALKVTIQVRSESRTTALQPACAEKSGMSGTSTSGGPKFCCYICKTSYHSLQNFQSHLVTSQHHEKIQNIQHLSNACLVTLLPTAKDSQGVMGGRDGKKKQMRWCNVCQVHFSCDLIRHRRTQEHKMAKRSLRPFCTVCSRHFKTPRKFVEHMKSPEHKQKSHELKLREKETWSPEESEELITVDAVGCFEEEEEDDDDDDDDNEEEGISADELSEDTECLPAKSEETTADQKEEEEGEEEYNADTAYGLDYMVPVAGYLCRLCHKFYPSDSAARLTHCKSLVHFQNVQKSKAEKMNRAVPQAEPSMQEDENGSREKVPLQDDGIKPANPADAHGASGGGGISVTYKSGDAEDPEVVFDSVIGTSEEDSSCLLDQEMLLPQKEDEAEGDETGQEETPCSDDTSSTRRQSSLRKVR